MQAWSSRPVPTLPPSAASHRLQAFDTAARQVVSIGPNTGTARIYVCGITPYDATHIGHANTYIAFDLLKTAKDKQLSGHPLHERRPALEAFAKAQFKSSTSFRLPLLPLALR